MELEWVPVAELGENRQSDFLPASHTAPALDWQALWRCVGHRYEQRTVSMRAQGEDGLRDELIFCLISGHAVPYELARSATSVVSALNPFDEVWSLDMLQQRLRDEFERPQFEPRRRDGELRRYRFPNRKATLLSSACSWVRGQGSVWQRLTALGCELERRAFLCDCPGVGMKTASFLLRNCGLADRLAVLDVHVLRLMRLAGRLADVTLPRDYARAEMQYLAWCGELEASPAAFDLLLWELGRGVLSTR